MKKKVIKKIESGIHIIHLFGEENFLKQQIIDAIINHYLKDPGLRDFNLTTYYGKECAIGKLFSDTQSLPMMTEKRIILVKNAHLIKKGDLKKGVGYLSLIPEQTILIIESDKSIGEPWKKVINQIGFSYESKVLPDYKIGEWIIDHTYAKFNRRISSQAALMLSSLRGNHLFILDQELTKIDLFLDQEKDITHEVVQFMTGSSKDYHIFAFTDSLLKKDLYRTLKILNFLLLENVPALMILTHLINFCNQLSWMFELTRKGLNPGDIQKQTRIHQFVFKKYFPFLKILNLNTIKKFIFLLLEADSLLKSSGKKERVIMEELMIKIYIEVFNMKR